MSIFQYTFGNPRKSKNSSNKGSRRSAVKKTRRKVKRRRNPMQNQWGKGATLRKGIVFPTGSELIAVKKQLNSIDSAISTQKKKIKSYKGPHRSAKHLGLLTDLESMFRDHKKSHTAYKNLKKLVTAAKSERTAVKARGAKPSTKLVKESIDPRSQKKITTNLSDLRKRLAATDKKIKATKKKAASAAKSAAKGGSVAKKKVTRKKKATKRKVAKKKVTRKKKVAKKKVTRKKVTRKKATKRKKVTKKRSVKKVIISAPKRTTKKIRRKSRKKATVMKSVRKALRKKGGVAKGKKRTYYARNPKNIFSKFGGNMKLKNLVKYDMPELGGLALGGALHGGASKVLSRIPFIGQYIDMAFSRVPFLAPLSPIALVIIVGTANKYIRKGKKLPEALELAMKGLVGASVVGLGATVGEYATSSIPALNFMQGEYNQLGGKLAHDYPGLDGNYNQLGLEESAYTIGGVVPSSFDSALPEVDPSEDFGIEYKNFDGEYDQLG